MLRKPLFLRSLFVSFTDVLIVGISHLVVKILQFFVIKNCAGIFIHDVTNIDECQARVLITHRIF